MKILIKKIKAIMGQVSIIETYIKTSINAVNTGAVNKSNDK